MEESVANVSPLTTTASHILRRLLTVGENRLELLAVEVQDERSRFIHTLLLAFGMVASGILAGITLTAAIVILLWPYSPPCVLVVLTVLYALVGMGLYRRLATLQRNWQPFSASREQLRKDRACLEKLLAWTRSNRGNDS